MGTPCAGPASLKFALLVCAGGSLFFAGGVSAQYVPFTQEAFARGLQYVMSDTLSVGMFGAGCGFADFDSDGDQDVIILGGKIQDIDPIGTIGLFENNGSGYFTPRTVGSGLAVMPKASAFAVADYDADGLQDLFISQMGDAYVLYRNTGNFHFADVTAQAGIADTGPNMGASWGDYDGDGWVDLHICSYNGAVQGFNQNDKLFRNLANGTFQDVSGPQGVADPGLAFQSVWFDYDRDGDVDLYVSHDRGHFPQYPENKLYRNDGGVLMNVSAESGAGVGLFSMGLACGDFDNNRWSDIYVTNLQGYAQGFNRLLLNQGNGTFIESAAAAAVDHWKTSWGCIFFDFDHNGAQDLYVNNQFLPNTLYANSGTFPCSVVNLGVGGNVGMSFSSAVGDIDNDGDLDLLVNNLGYNGELFINNHAAPTRRWLEYKMVGIYPNLNAIGGNVDTRIGATWRYREILAGGNGYQGQNDFTVHVGVGAALTAAEVVVTWPGGSPTRTLTNVPTNSRWTLYPPAMLGDADGDGTVNLDDFHFYIGCHGQFVAPGTELMDFDGNWQINGVDFDAFLASYDEPLDDCDKNGLVDLEQILLDPKLDADANGILDSCEQAPLTGDINNDGEVDVDDLLMVINSWGACKDCPADIAPEAGNDIVDVDDLLVVINHWG
jgi:hypothetical protein